ncbi:AAA-like domain-containing protein [Armatimonas rosea]|uniref:DNA-binding SARP family transcriptional activator n=1 Tax=Armatimonas rosea TaxID=685828 RepID=A0A7W9W7F2_ARMRO|nr:AAA-like domain-containing protein [Armatimonas rosea]MBB6050567.1 DNA-binding SARP family transcriptional activator [Armatimonas rosea]
MSVHIELLGRPAIVFRDGSRVEHFPTRKAAALLGYLALCPGVPQPREVLAELFWPEVEPVSGRNSLNVALNALRTSLGEALTTDRTYVQLLPEHVTTDLALALETGRSFDPDQLLAGFYDDFVIAERERLKALGLGSAKSAPTLTETRRIVPGGAVPLEASYYIERATDGALRDALRRTDSIILLKGAHEVGKTSLLARGAQAARQSRARVALTDLATLPETDATAFFRALATSLADELGVDESPEALWSEARSPAMNLERFVRRAVLEPRGTSVVWALDEVDRLFELPFGPDLFRLFRSWHNRRSLEPDGPWSGLTLVIAYATEAQLFLTDLHQSPFNVGTRLTLSDFTLEDTAELNRRFGSPLVSSDQLLALREWIGGQPYLNHLAFHALSDGLPLAELLAQALNPEGLFGGHLRRLSASLQRSPGQSAAIQSLLEGKQTLSQEPFYRLRAAGLLAGDSSSEARFRCRLYRDWLLRNAEP